MTTFYDLKANSLTGQEKSMADYQNKVVLVVNTASKCGLTPQYEGLQDLYKELHDEGLEILGFPCNQFGKQEPGSADDISDFCELNYGVNFPMFEKIDVNGDATHPVFTYLKDELPGTFGKKIKWNFTKFLIGKDGQPIKRFAPTTKPEDIKKHIEKALSA